MDFILGILGILQITLIPGLILCKSFRFQTNVFDKALIIFGTSLISNYCSVFLLSALGIYTRTTLSIFLIGELIAIFWLYRNNLTISMKNLLNATQEGMNEIASFFFPTKQKDEGSVLYYFLGIILLILSVRGILWAMSIVIQNLGSVFSSWDAVVSWNHWATVWATGQIPMDSHFYPQLIPANWSITYVLLGNSTLQFFAKGIMPLFTLMMLIGFLNLGIQTKQPYFLFALVLLPPLLKKFINDGLYNGYVDIAVAFFGFATIYMLIKAQQQMLESEQRKQLYILGAIFSAGAAVTKQTGVYIALCYPVLVFINAVRSKPPIDGKQLKTLVSVFAAVSIIWVSWYVLKEIQILAGTDRANIDTLISLSANTYGNTNLFQQIAASIGQYKELLILFSLIVISFLWMDPFYKALTLLFVPYPLLWAWMAAYDTRNLAIFLPVLALVAGYSLHKIFTYLMNLSEETKILQIPVYAPVVFAGIALFSLNFVFSPPQLHQRQAYLQKQVFSPIKNQMLYDLVRENGPQTRILTNYPMNYLPGLEPYQVRFNFQDYDLFLTHIKNPEIEYMLVPNAIDQNIKDYIETKIEAGDYEVLLKDKQWKVFTLIKILKR